VVFTAYVRQPDTRQTRPVDWPLDAPAPDATGRALLHLTTAMAVTYEKAGYAIWCPTCHDTPDWCPEARRARAHALRLHGLEALPRAAGLRLAPARTW
jgi:hypothetical protein